MFYLNGKTIVVIGNKNHMEASPQTIPGKEGSKTFPGKHSRIIFEIFKGQLRNFILK
jgi:hypothetical protein